METNKLFQLNDKWYSTKDIETFNKIIDSYYDKGVIESEEQYNLKRMEEEEYFLLEEDKYLELYESSTNERNSKIIYEEEVEYLLDSENKVSYDLSDSEDREKFSLKYDELSRKAKIDYSKEEVVFEDDKRLNSYEFGKTYKSNKRERDFEEFDKLFQNTELEYEHDISEIMFKSIIFQLEDEYDLMIIESNMSSSCYYDSEEVKLYVNADNGLLTRKRMIKNILHELSFEKEKISQEKILKSINFNELFEEEEKRIIMKKEQLDWEENLFSEDSEMYA